MKKAVMLSVMFAVAAVMAQTPKQSVAVYMAGTEPAAVRGAQKVMGAELAKALAKSGNFTAVDRTDEVIKVLAAADIFRKDGGIDLDKAKRAGKQLGAQMLCVAEITNVMGTYFLEARLVNTETAELSNVATTYGDLRSAGAVVGKAQMVAMELVGGKKRIVDYTFKEIEANPDKAIRDYTDAIRQEPNEAEYYYKRGYAYYWKDEYDIAIMDVTEAIRLAPKEALYFFYRGFIHMGLAFNVINLKDVKEKKEKEERLEKAIADLSQAIRLNPNYADAYVNRGLTHFQLAEVKNTIAGPLTREQLLQSFERKPEKSIVDRAIADLDQAIRSDPNHEIAYYNRGLMYRVQGDDDKAITNFNQAIRLNPDYEIAYEFRGRTYEEKGDYDRAIADYSQVVRLNPGLGEYYRRGETYYKKGDYAKAISDFEACLRIAPNQPNAVKLLAEARQKIGSGGGGSAKQVQSGGSGGTSIQRVVTQNMAALRYAYNRRLRDKPGLAGTINVKFAIDEFGTVIFAKVVESTMKDPELERTVVDRVKSWKFEGIVAPGDVTEIVYPFSFSQEGGSVIVR